MNDIEYRAFCPSRSFCLPSLLEHTPQTFRYLDLITRSADDYLPYRSILLRPKLHDF